jgi:hypothetical protein
MWRPRKHKSRQVKQAESGHVYSLGCAKLLNSTTRAFSIVQQYRTHSCRRLPQVHHSYGIPDLNSAHTGAQLLHLKEISDECNRCRLLFETTYQGVARLACFGLAHIEAKFEIHTTELVVCMVKTLELPQVRRARTWDVPDALTAVSRVRGPRQGFSRSTCSR